MTVAQVDSDLRERRRIREQMSFLTQILEGVLREPLQLLADRALGGVELLLE